VFAETAPLVAQLRLDDKFSGPLKKASGTLSSFSSKLDQSGMRMSRATQQIGRGISNVVKLAVVGASALTGLLALSVKEGQDAAKVQTVYAQSIANSGRVTAQYVGILNAQQKALMNLGGVDDELIKTEQTRLIQMGLTGEQVAKLTPLILDLSKATGRDLIASTVAVGKAVNGSTAGLIKFGVVIDKAKAKADPYGATVDALASKFGGVTKALSGSLETRLGAFREALANIREEAGMKLLPVLTRIVDVAGKDLVPAFGAFIDRILPSVISGLDEFSRLLENGGAERGIKGITDALGPMVDLLKLAAAPVKAIVSAFLSLPSQVQGVLVGAFAVNKLTGGLVTNVAAGAAQQLFQRGGSPANPLFVSDIAGGLGKGAGAGAGLGLVSKVFLVGEAIGLVLLVNSIRQGIADGNTKTATVITDQTTKWLAQSPSAADLEKGLAGVKQGIHDIELTPFHEIVQGEALDRLRAMQLAIEKQLRVQRDSDRRLAEVAHFGRPFAVIAAALAAEADVRRTLSMHATSERLDTTLSEIGSTLTKVQQELHADFRAAIEALRKATSPADILAAAARLVKDVRAGVGGAASTGSVVADLKAKRDAALGVGDKATAAALTAAIRKIEPFVKGREWQAAQIAQGKQIVASSESQKQKVAELSRIMNELKDHQRTSAAAQIAALLAIVTGVNVLPGALRNALGGILFTGTAPGKTKDDRFTPRIVPKNSTGGPDDRGGNINITTKASVSASDVSAHQVVHRRFGRPGGSRVTSTGTA
jgi:hypothetical protein